MRRFLLLCLPILLLVVVRCGRESMLVSPTSQGTAPTTVLETRGPTTTPSAPAVATSQPTPAIQTPATPTAGLIVHTQVEGDPPRSGALWRASLDGSNDRQIVTVAPDRTISDVAVSPDGDLIVYKDERIGTGNDGERNAQLHLVNADGTGERVLLTEADAVSAFSFSPDSAYLAIYQSFATDQALIYEHEIGVVPTAGGELRQIVARDRAVGPPVWLDAASIGYTRAAPPAEIGDIVRVAINTNEASVTLTHGRLISVAPKTGTMLVSLEPIGDNIATDQQFTFGVVAQDTASSSILRQWKLPVGEFAWSPDGARLAQRGIDGSARLLNIANGSVDMLPNLGAQRNLFTALGWDSTGTGLIYATTTSGPTAATELRRLDLRDHSERVLLRLPGSTPPIIVICTSCTP